ncbi:50S ribosome-binding GTPase, partial [bacterium]|nr:50S ribosome-binding GTPase [bacterium]
MQSTPKGFRLHIGLFGRRNVGKSSLLNALTRQAVSIVSDIAGTTTDPIEKPMEILPIGPCLFIDTAGIDDIGALGEERVRRTRQVFNRTDLAVLVAEADRWGVFEEELLREFQSRETPVLVVFNKVDLDEPSENLVEALRGQSVPLVRTQAPTDHGILDVREALIRLAPEDFINAPSILGALVPPGEMAV